MPGLERVFQMIMNKITLMIGRGIVAYVSNASATQKMQIRVLANEVLEDVERLEEYGFTSYPLSGAELVALFMGGRRQHGIVIKAHDRRYRPTDLAEGEVCIYTNEDGSGHRIHFKNGRGIDIKCNSIDETVDSDKISSVGGSKTEVISEDYAESCLNKTITATNVTINAGSITLGGPGAKALLSELAVAVFNGHTHDENGDTTDPPNQSLSVGSHCTSVTKAL